MRLEAARLEAQDLFEQGARIGDVALFGTGDAEIEVGVAVVRRHRNGALVARDGIVDPALRPQNVSQIALCVDMIRGKRQRPPVGGHSRIKTLLPFVY